MSLASIANQGLRRAEERIQRAAERLARLPLSSDSSAQQDVVDLSAETIALLEAKNAHAASAKVLQTSAELDEHILDVLG